jgi:hypothetical protein
VRRVTLVIVALVGLAHAAPAKLVVPYVGAAIRCDGELDEFAWRTPARTGGFVDARGEMAAPYSDARLLHDDRYLYLALYAADEDIRASDEFVVEIASPRARRTLHVTAAGVLTPAIAGSQIAVDVDGRIDDPTNDDEEWVIEAAIPLAQIPLGPDGSAVVRVSRCDVGKDRITRCASWRGAIAVRPR